MQFDSEPFRGHLTIQVEPGKSWHEFYTGFIQWWYCLHVSPNSFSPQQAFEWLTQMKWDKKRIMPQEMSKAVIFLDSKAYSIRDRVWTKRECTPLSCLVYRYPDKYGETFKEAFSTFDQGIFAVHQQTVQD